MRIIMALVLGLALTGCEFMEQQTSKAVDPANLPPLTSREQALIFGADGALAQKNYEAAERDYLSAVAASSGRVEAHLALANLYEKQHLPEKKRAILESAIELQPTHPLANYWLGKLYLDAGDYTAARTAFKRGRERAGDDMDLTMGEAVTLDMMGDHRDAQELYTRLVRNHPGANLSLIRTNLAMSYLLSNKPEDAVELLKNDATKPEASPVSRHNLALAYGLLGRGADAKTLLKGEIDEETRQLAVARMKAYHQERMANQHAAPPEAVISDAAVPVEPLFGQARVPVVQKSPAKAVESKPKAEKPAAKPEAHKVAAPAEAKPTPASKTAEKPVTVKAEPVNPESPGFDPNYIPGLTDEDDGLDAGK